MQQPSGVRTPERTPKDAKDANLRSPLRAFIDNDRTEALKQLVSDPIVWSDDFLVRVPAIDDQHKKLFYLAERLRQVLFEKKAHKVDITGKDLKPVQVILHWLVQYCVVHFELEERVQESVRHPGIEEHKVRHREFATECEAVYTELCKAMTEDRSVDIVPIFEKVLNWLVNHVCGMDRKIGEWCAQQDIDVNIPDLQDLTDSIPEELPDLSRQDLLQLLRNPKGNGKHHANPY